MTIYLCTAPITDTALQLAGEGAIVLLQDAVASAARVPRDTTCYAISEDMERRGITNHVPAHIQPLTYGELVDLLIEHPVVNLG